MGIETEEQPEPHGILRQFFGGTFHPDWRYDFFSVDAAIRYEVRIQPIWELNRLCEALAELHDEGLSEGALEERLMLLGSSYYAPGRGGTYRGWVEHLLAELRRGVAEKEVVYERFAGRPDSHRVAAALRTWLSARDVFPQHRHMRRLLEQFSYGWRRRGNQAQDLVHAHLESSSLAFNEATLRELDDILARSYTELELEFVLHTGFRCHDFVPVEGATFGEGLRWLRDEVQRYVAYQQAASMDIARYG